MLQPYWFDFYIESMSGLILVISTMEEWLESYRDHVLSHLSCGNSGRVQASSVLGAYAFDCLLRLK